MSNEALQRIDDSLTAYRKNGPSASISIDLASAIREARELIGTDQRSAKQREADYWAGPGCEDDERG